MNIEHIKNICHQLRLNGVGHHVERRSREAVTQQLHPFEFLRLILEDELMGRKDRLGKTLTTCARFRFAAELEDWDQPYSRGITKAEMHELCHLAFYDGRENLLIFGRTGEGKTHLAISLGRRLCHKGTQTLFLSVNHLFEEVAAAKASGTYLSLLRRLTSAKVLILDDFGLRNYSHEEATLLLDILEDRYRKGSIIVTSQLDAKGWPKLFEDPIVAEAIIDRLVHPSRKILLHGGSYREKLVIARPQSKKQVIGAADRPPHQPRSSVASCVDESGWLEGRL